MEGLEKHMITTLVYLRSLDLVSKFILETTGKFNASYRGYKS